jgi:hypothetical protein
VCYPTIPQKKGIPLFLKRSVQLTPFFFPPLYLHRAYYGSQTQFPVLEPTDKTIRKPGTHEPVEKYFDSKAERRQLGTGFYALSSDPEERLAQQEELRQREQETVAARSAAHKADHQSLESPAEKLIQDRKRLLQAKKDQLANKRLKKDAPVPVPESHATPS